MTIPLARRAVRLTLLAICLNACAGRAVEVYIPAGFERAPTEEQARAVDLYATKVEPQRRTLTIIVRRDLEESAKDSVRKTCGDTTGACATAVLGPLRAGLQAMGALVDQSPPWPGAGRSLTRAERRPGAPRFQPDAACTSERWEIGMQIGDMATTSRGITTRCDFDSAWPAGPWLTEAVIFEIRPDAVEPMPANAFEDMAEKVLSSLRP